MSDLVNEKEIPFSSAAEGKAPVANDGAYKNLVSQIDAILARSNERSIKSRYRYYEGACASVDS